MHIPGCEFHCWHGGLRTLLIGGAFPTVGGARQEAGPGRRERIVARPVPSPEVELCGRCLNGADLSRLCGAGRSRCEWSTPSRRAMSARQE